ncbi:23S rRNA (adenine(2503)-C(2))-methyltransferase RlmN [Phragmitibacter flavus]|uniref:Probable dual-specificity RNA methyltransferase RlmN n=1 Tax=Phragmitibacter flavus TaxID=2576071 RepID=A0A5R8KFG6_9BACT|nr:23S rRNA (adenine(2503)-C(2))-methyltransferase RlmN [Phragmitibacter flavus]TLD71033.1 23S rRNA (adenine(2503)-C(2))-methyltransferase RlmN [Phragmitibacter flavus]
MSDAVPISTSLLAHTPEELISVVAQAGEKSYRAKQLIEWIHRKRVETFDEMTNLSKPLLAYLNEHHTLRTLTLARVEGSADTTRKYLFKLHDGRFVETVLIPASVSFAGERSNRRTLCVSSQVGCAYDCKFCASGLAGFTRNLTASEIVEQIVQVEKHAGERIDNLVFMGMGEPLANYNNVTRAITALNAQWGVNIGARHITVSTSGLAPQIKKLAEFPLQVRLAISLHGASDEVRNQIMPVNRKHPLDELFEALHFWRQHKKQRITFEFILIKDINDSDEQARLLAHRARNIDAKVNLIPYNTVDGLQWERPDVPQQDRFRDIVASHDVVVTLRREKGHDIAAACGQLRLREETQLGIIAAPVPEKRRSITTEIHAD